MSAGNTGLVPAGPDAIINKLVAEYMTRTRTPGVAVALYADGQDGFFPFGHASLATQQPVTADTIFGIGSVTKVFTATLLAYQAGTGAKRLTDPLPGYLPADVTNPALEAVTLEMLATHTSGFPRDGGGPAADALFDNQPPSPELIHFWNTWSPTDPQNVECARCPVGTCWQYSNAGFVTLGFAVVGRPGPPRVPGYNGLLADLITTPLGMPATVALIPPGASVAQGYRVDGRGPGHPLVPVDSQAADLKSSARDMRTWLKANLGTPGSLPPPLSAALTLTQGIYFRGAQQCSTAGSIPFDMGLAWQQHPLVDGGPVTYAKDGATSQGGYSCWIGFIPARQLGLAVLTNLIGGGGPTGLGLAILTVLAAGKAGGGRA